MNLSITTGLTWRSALTIVLVMSATAATAKEVACDVNRDSNFDAKVAAREIDSIVYRIRRGKCLFDVNGETASLSHTAVSSAFAELIGPPEAPGALANHPMGQITEEHVFTLVHAVANDDQDANWQKTVQAVLEAGLKKCLAALREEKSIGYQYRQPSGSMRCMTQKSKTVSELGPITVMFGNSDKRVRNHRVIEVSDHLTHWVGFIVPVVEK